MDELTSLTCLKSCDNEVLAMCDVTNAQNVIKRDSITAEKAQQMFYFGEMIGQKRVAHIATAALTEMMSDFMQQSNSLGYFIKRKK